MIVKGWPDTLQEVPPAIRCYWSFRDVLFIEDGLILKGQRLLIPNSLCEDILEQLHYGHLGIEKTVGERVSLLAKHQQGH